MNFNVCNDLVYLAGYNCLWSNLSMIPAGVYFLKVNNGSNRAMCEICSKLTMLLALF